MILWILYVFLTLFIDFDTILPFLGLKMEADILVQRDGRDSAVRRPRFFIKIHVFNFSNPFFAGKSKIDSSIKNLSFVMVLWETAWGKMCVLTVGSCHVFTEILTLTCVLHVKIHVCPEILICVLSV